jgi:putative membrane protein
MTTPPAADDAILSITRPHADLMKYYLIASFVIPPIFPILMLIGGIRYRTMRYKFTAEGISMSWGLLFRKEIIIQYSRIQDIHLRSNMIERWLGLSKVLVQTASGSSSAEMTLEGLKQFEAVRDFLYHRMRGVKDDVPAVESAATTGNSLANDELTATLRAVAAELRALRMDLAARKDGDA